MKISILSDEVDDFYAIVEVNGVASLAVEISLGNITRIEILTPMSPAKVKNALYDINKKYNVVKGLADEQ